MSVKMIRLGRGATLNESLVGSVESSKGKYFVHDVYGVKYEVDHKHYVAIVKNISKDKVIKG